MKIWYGKVVGSDRNIPFRLNGAAGKARQDAYKFLDEIGAQELNMYSYFWKDEPDQMLSARMDALLGGVKVGDIVIQLYPNGTNSPRYNNYFFDKVHRFGAKLVGYIHDLEVYRGNIEDWKSKEVNIPYKFDMAAETLNKYDALMVPTENMAIRIRKDFQFKAPILVTGPHGFKTPMIPYTREKSDTVIFAGSFEKNRSLNKLMDTSSKIKFNIYGGSSGEYGAKVYLDEHKNAKLMGKFDPDALLMMLEGSYGLVWDSLDYPEVSGGKGFYEILNTPHKFSMYLAAEIPVIVWSRMGLAEYVKDNNIGWVIDDLSELQNLVMSITEEDYNDKLSSLQKVGGLIRSGIQLKISVLKAASILNEKPTYKKGISEFPAPELGIDKWVIDMDLDKNENLKEIEFSKEVLKYYSNNLYQTEQYQKARNIMIQAGKI